MTLSPKERNPNEALIRLRARWWAAVGLCFLIQAVGFLLLGRDFDRPNASQLIFQSTLITIYELALLRFGLNWNYHPAQKVLRSTLGYGTWLTIIRGALVAVLAGFLFQPWPASKFFPGRLSWAPGLLYITASLLDYFDGRVARACRHETRLGAFLDINLDALGLLIAPLVAVWYDQLPAVYLSVGFAYYVYMAGIGLRKKFSMPVVEPGPWRGARIIAGSQMGFVGIALLPVMKPPATTLTAYIMMIPLLAGFVRDWMIVCGYWKPGSFSTNDLSMKKDRSQNNHTPSPTEASNAEKKAITRLLTGPIDSIERFESCLSGARAFRLKSNRPFITVSYAQSVDGSIATKSRQPLGLSGPDSAVLTHQIRACNDAILIGIGTLLTDDPRLNVRLVEGSSPQPVILDTHLRTPLNAKLVKRSDIHPWIINAEDERNENFVALQNAGSTPICCATSRDGKIDLHALMKILAEKQINSIMVEGGARVITSFVNCRLVDQFIVTISPRLVGGLPVIDTNGLQSGMHLDLAEVSYRHCGNDLIIWARPNWQG